MRNLWSGFVPWAKTEEGDSDCGPAGRDRL